MKKCLLLVLLHLTIGYVDAQQITVVNKNHITISGVSLIQQFDEVTYTADFFYPDETNGIQWVVAGGTVLSQNNDPLAGPISVTVRWNLPNTPLPDIQGLPIDPNACGAVAITQGHDLENIYQGAYLFIYRIGDGSTSNPFIGCQLNPKVQYVNYGQSPCVISGVPNCISPLTGIPHTYQWYYYDNSISNWALRANTVNYQPPVNEYETPYRRVTQDNIGNTNTTPSPHGGLVVVKLYDLNPGTLFSNALSIPYGQQPIIRDEMPYGGPCKSQDYVIAWEVSYNFEPWQTFGTSVHLPVLPGGIKKRSVRIRRVVNCDINKAESNTIEFTYSEQIPKEDKNYVKVNSVLVKGIADPYEASLLPIGSRLQNSDYYDGLGRPIQNVKPGVGSPPDQYTPKWSDIVTPTAYDGAGRIIRNYLPYPSFGLENNFFKSDAVAQQENYYLNNFSETISYGQIEYDNNPSNSIKRTKLSGESWATNFGCQKARIVFNLSEEVMNWFVSSSSLSVPEVRGIYKTGELYKLQSIDEHGGITYEYRDKNGKLILNAVLAKESGSEGEWARWLYTYYVYDELDRMRCVITPKAVKYLHDNSWVLTQEIIDELCFYNDYDYKGRVVYKQTPQAGGISLIYDNRNRLVMSQDAKQKVTNQWLFTLYDELDREKVTGIMVNLDDVKLIRKNVETVIPQIVSTLTISLGATMGQENVDVFTDVSILGTSIEYYTLKYYDDYNYQNVINFNTNHGINPTSNPNEEPIVSTVRAIDMITGQKARILDNSGRVLTTTLYYDDDTRGIQIIKDNIKDGRDTKTSQYDFGGRVLNSSSIHTSSGTGYSDFPIYTHNTYDKLGRPILTSKQFGTNPSKDIAAYSYDFLSRVKLKRLGLNPITGGDEMESLEYTYTINGQLQGINEYYAKKDPARYEKWKHFFGLYLGYDNKNLAFANRRLDGKITGAMWSTQGDDVQRKYDYSYDMAGRLIKSQFAQKDDDAPSSTWSNDKFDFSVRGSTGYIKYDENGNLLELLQMGVIPGRNPSAIDNLEYEYSNGGYSNKLINVNERHAIPNLDGILGDFRDVSSNTIQYDYDENGNLIRDENKQIQGLNGNSHGVEYNYLDKVEKVKTSKGVTEFIYDATGNKLQKIFTPDAGSPKTVSYIDEYIFEDDRLQFINFEEGRLRIIEAVATTERSLSGNFSMPGNTGTLQGVFDYFIKDNLGNTRVIITEEQQWETGNCTMDASNQTVENVEWGQITALGTPGPGNELISTRTQVPPSWTINTSSDCVKLYNADGKRIGPNKILKVMAGDLITAKSNYFYLNNINSSNQPPLVNNIITSLIGTILGGTVSGMVKEGNSNDDVQDLLTNSGAIFSYVTNSNNESPGSTTPKAYINIIFLDEQFNYVGSANPDRVDIAGEGNIWHKVEIPSALVPQNGYAYIYLSNESNEQVYFDNMHVEHERGRLVEENHYYPFGLKIAGISSRKAGFTENGTIKNLFLYQSDFAEHDEETGWDEFDLRTYDPQIGRWMQTDPYKEFASPYVGMGNDPINFVDEDGGSIGQVLAWAGILGGGVAAHYIIKNNPDLNPFIKGLIRLGAPLVTGALLYATGESIDPGTQGLDAFKNGSANFWGNFRSFFLGVFGITNGTARTPGGDLIQAPNLGIFDVIDDTEEIWSILNELSIVTNGLKPGKEDQQMERKKTTSSPDIGPGGFGSVSHHQDETTVDLDPTKDPNVRYRLEVFDVSPNWMDIVSRGLYGRTHVIPGSTNNLDVPKSGKLKIVAFPESYEGSRITPQGGVEKSGGFMEAQIKIYKEQRTIKEIQKKRLFRIFRIWKRDKE